MKKIIIGLIAAAIIAVVLVPFVNGIIMEKVVKQNQSDVNDIYAETGSDISIDIVQYDRHFTSSDIVWKIDLGKMKSFYGIEEILFVDHAKHGFTGVVSTTSLEKNPWFNTFIEEHMGGSNPFNITTRYGLSGTIESTVEINAFSMETEGETLAFKPATIVITCEEGLEHLKSSLHWDGAAVDTLVIGKLALEYDLKKISSYIWDGTAAYDLERIAGTDQDSSFELSGFTGTYFLNYAEKENTLTTGMEIDFDSLVSPEVTIEDGSIKMAVDKLNAQGYEDFMNVYTRTLYSAIDDISAAENNPEQVKNVMEQQMATAGLQMLSAYEKILRKGLELKVSDFRATLSEGKVRGHLSLTLNDDLTFAQMAPIMQQPAIAFDLVSIDSELRFPAILAGDDPMLVAPLFPGMKTGFFEKDGNDLVHRAKTKDNTLFLNGQEVSFEQ